jgi:outer membrane receptor protein involved in Fe transport
LLWLLAAIVFHTPAWAQSDEAAAVPEAGTVVGRVFDAVTGNPVEKVKVVLKGPAPEAGKEPRQEVQSTKDDGAFEFRSVEPGSYSIEFARSGYRDSIMTDFSVQPGQENRADFPLPPVTAAKADDPTQLEEFVVKAEKVEDLLDVRIESDQLLNVVGAEEFSKFAAGDVAEVLERVAGVNVVEGQFAIIRGLEDRYSNTLYNGAPIPSPDPDSQSVQLDLFPSEVVGNLSVSKTFSPEEASNSSGGAINIITHEYPDEIELGLKAGTGWNDNAENEFLELQGHTNVDRIVNGLAPTGTLNGRPVYPDIKELKKNGFRFIEGNPVGVESDKNGNFFHDIGNVLESDYVANLGGTKEFGGREFRFKAVVSRETDYGTAEGFQESLEPKPPRFGPTTFIRNPRPPFNRITIPGKLEESGGLTLGELDLSEGQYDLTISQKEQQTTGFAGFGFDLDEEGQHNIDASFFYTKLEEDAVELQENGTLPNFDYAAVSESQLAGEDFPPDALEFVAPGSAISNALRAFAFAGPERGALAFSTFSESTSFETDRDLWVAQINGDHTFDRLPGLHFSWAYNRAETTQNESALGMGFFFEPCGYSASVPCAPGTELIPIPSEIPTLVGALGPGKFATQSDLLVSANSIEEHASFYRLDADYALDFSDVSTFTLAGGVWVERASRDVDSAFLESPTLPFDVDTKKCPGTGREFACLDETPFGLGASAFNELSVGNGNLDGIRTTSNESSRDIDAWHLRGKLTLWETLDLLGGIRREHIFIQSLNDPFFFDPVSGELVRNVGVPTTFPASFLFFNRLDNPFNAGVDGLTQRPPPGVVYNDQLLGTTVTPGACVGDDGRFPGIQCVDLVDQAALQDLFNGTIDEHRLLPSAGFNLRPMEGLSLRGAWSQTVARPSFREMGYYVTVVPGNTDLIVGNPQLELSNVESWDARVEYTWGSVGDLLAVSYFQKTIDTPIESIIVRDPLNAEASVGGLFQTFFNNPNTADLWGIEAEARKNIDFLDPYVPEWVHYFSIGGNYTYIDAKVGRTEAELARSRGFFGLKPGDQALFTELAPTRRLFGQPEWIANADLTFDHPGWGLQATVAYFAISDVLDAAGTATLSSTGDVLSFTLDRYVGSYMDLRATVAKTVELPGALGALTFRATAKNLTDSSRRLIYDTFQTNKEIAQQELRVGRDYSFSITFSRAF